MKRIIKLNRHRLNRDNHIVCNPVYIKLEDVSHIETHEGQTHIYTEDDMSFVTDLALDTVATRWERALNDSSKKLERELKRIGH